MKVQSETAVEGRKKRWTVPGGMVMLSPGKRRWVCEAMVRWRGIGDVAGLVFVNVGVRWVW